MRRLAMVWGVICGALGSGPVVAAAAAAAPDAAVHQYTIQQFLATVNWGGGQFSPDGKTLLASNDSSGVINVYSVPTTGGEAQQLTHSTVSANRALGYFPDGKRVLYAADKGGNEQTHLYVLEPDGTSRDLTPGDKVKAQFMGWSHDDRSLFFGTTERDPHYFDVYEMPVDLSSRKMLFKNEGGYTPDEVSADRRLIALGKPGESSEDSDVSVYDVATGTIRLLTAHQGDVANGTVGFSTDSKWLYATTTATSEFSSLQRFDLATGKATTVFKPQWDVVGGTFSRDGHYLAISVNADARTETHLFALPAMTEVALPALPDADVTQIIFSHDSREMAFYGESSREPRNLFVLALGAAGAAPRQLTHSLNPAIDPHDLVTAERIRFASYDGMQIPGILYRPSGASAGHLVPALVSVHGGPGGQSRVGYSAATQYLVNHGYAIFAINNRGSGGYGKTFVSLDDRKHGEVDLDDCVSSKKMLKDTGWVDPQRIGIMGGSYGGYMVLAALTFRPQESVLGVDLFGVANWVRTLESIPPDWAAMRKALFKEMGDPAVDHDYLVRISPLFHTEKIEHPLIVLQGENDPRVLRQESDEIVAALRSRHIPVAYELYPNEGHGFARKETQAKAYGAILDFLNTYLKAPAH